jgi:hypothetical protein
MPSLLIDEERRVEDLERLVRVERDDHVRDRREVPVHERAQSAAVLDGTAARSSGHEELEYGRAERVLEVDGEQADASPVSRCRLDRVLRGPRPRLAEAGLVVDSPDVRDPVEVDVARHGKLVEHRAKATTATALESLPDGRATDGRDRRGQRGCLRAPSHGL